MDLVDDRIQRANGTGVRAVVFDMDGTLVSSLSTILHCESKISLKYTGKPLTLEDVISKFGPPARTIIRDMTASLPDPVQSRAVSEYYDCYSTTIRDKGLIFPGVTSLLQKIKSSARDLALFTGVEKKMMEYTLEPFGLSRFFKTIVTADDIEKSKPDPEGVVLAVKRLNARPRESIYIGDSPADIQSGRQAGVLTGAALWSPENRGDPTKEHPDFVFRSVDQLADFLFPKKRSNQEPYFGSRQT